MSLASLYIRAAYQLEWMPFWQPLPTVGEQLLTLAQRPVEKNNSSFGCSFNTKPFKAALAKPFCLGSQGWGMFFHKNHAAGESNGSIMVGMFVCCVFCWPKAFQARVFVSARTDLAI
jgi:hypothetical protein